MRRERASYIQHDIRDLKFGQQTIVLPGIHNLILPGKMDFTSMLSNLKRNASSMDSANPSIKRVCVESSKEVMPPMHTKPVVSKIYLACPANLQTGGPEAMHQLCDKINRVHSSKVKAYMLYLKISSHDSGQERYKLVSNAIVLPCYQRIYHNILVAKSLPSYDTPCDLIKDERSTFTSNLIIWPECWTQLIDMDPEDSDRNNNEMVKCQFHQTAIWWLSVDNNNSRFKEWKRRRDILHLYQSHYAREYILSNLEEDMSSSQVLPLTEFIPTRIEKSYFSHFQRDIDVLYNPFKGVHFTDAIKNRSKNHFTFVPIGGERKLTPEEVTSLLHRARIYIDFGPHPGMDRLPREAALANCIVITNMAGSAKYKEDIPIPQEYKLQVFDVDMIHKLIGNCLTNYDSRVKDFDPYRMWIDEQEAVMDRCIEKLIQTIC